MKKYILFLLIISPILIFSQSNSREENYFSNNRVPSEYSFSEGGIMSRYRVYLNGELHWKKVNMKANIEMLVNLRRERNLKTVLMEYSSSCQVFINAFVRGEYWMEDSLKMLKPFVHYDENFFLPIKTMHDLNINVPEKDKISVVCLGVENNYVQPIMALKLLVKHKLFNPSIESKINFIRIIALEGIDSISIEEKQKYFNELYLQITDEKESFEVVLGESFDLFYRIVEGTKLYNGYNYDVLHYNVREPKFDIQFSFGQKREEFITKHFIKVINKHPDEVFFGQFGRDHCKLTYGETVDFGLKWYSLASRLNTNENSPVKGQVCTIDVMTKKRFKNTLKEEGYSLNKEEKKYLKLGKGFYYIDQKESPFQSLKNQFQFIYVR